MGRGSDLSEWVKEQRHDSTSARLHERTTERRREEATDATGREGPLEPVPIIHREN